MIVDPLRHASERLLAFIASEEMDNAAPLSPRPDAGSPISALRAWRGCGPSLARVLRPVPGRSMTTAVDAAAELTLRRLPRPST